MGYSMACLWYGTLEILLTFVGRKPSLFANWVREHPNVATSTTPLERRYLRHFLTYVKLVKQGLMYRHVCRVAPAIDEATNGLRTTILPMASSDAALLNTILAVTHITTT